MVKSLVNDLEINIYNNGYANGANQRVVGFNWKGDIWSTGNDYVSNIKRAYDSFIKQLWTRLNDPIKN